MVAASVVTTILVLNYHHRQADTHEMPEWVSGKYGKTTLGFKTTRCLSDDKQTAQK